MAWTIRGCRDQRTRGPADPDIEFACACFAAALGEVEDVAWLAGLGLVGGLGERGASTDFPDLIMPLRKAYIAKALRETVSLVNAPRRSAFGDAGPALRLLLGVQEPNDIVSGQDKDAAALRAARAEVKVALDQACTVALLFAGPVALIRCDPPCQIHPLVAQSWTHRLRRQVVMGAKAGFRAGYVHFAARSATLTDLITFLEERAPSLGPDDQFAQGHRRATGGQVRIETWNRFVAGLGFGTEAQVI